MWEQWEMSLCIRHLSWGERRGDSDCGSQVPMSCGADGGSRGRDLTLLPLLSAQKPGPWRSTELQANLVNLQRTRKS